MPIPSAKSISILCCRAALALTLICLGLDYSVGALQSDVSEVVVFSLLFCLPYVAGELVARMLAKNRIAGVLFMILTVAVSAYRLCLSVAVTHAVLQPDFRNAEESMIGLAVVFELWAAVVQLAVTALFAGYAFWTARRRSI